MKLKFFGFCVGLIFAGLCLQTHVYAGTWADASATAAGGTRNYRVWIPDGYQTGSALPMILMLHGCTQNPNDFAAGTQMNLLADQYKFFAAYAEQPSSANGSNCWNWFLPEHQTRNSGEPSVLAQIVRDVQTNYAVRADRTFVAGISAGAAMTVILGAAYPDLFAAIGVAAGLEYRAGSDVLSGVIAQQLGGPDPNAQGQIAFAEMRSRARRMPLIVFHGTLDATVQPVNGAQVIAQWAQTNDFIDDGFDNDSVDNIADQIFTGTVPNGGRTYTRSIYADAEGRPLLEFWSVEMMRHAWSGGSSAGSYTDPTGPNASFEMVRFFNLNLTPTAAFASLGGRVADRKGNGLANVKITVAGGNLDAPRIERTNSFGYFQFKNLPAGATYVITAEARKFRFEPAAQVYNLTENFGGMIFTAEE